MNHLVRTKIGWLWDRIRGIYPIGRVTGMVVLSLVRLGKVVHLHSIRSADRQRIMAHWAFVVGIHGRTMRLCHRGCNIGQRLGKRDRVAMVVITHVQHGQLLMVLEVLVVLWR